MNNKAKPIKTILIPTILLLVLLTALFAYYTTTKQDRTFDGDLAYKHVEYQVSLGSRTPGSDAHEKTISWIIDNLESSSWEVEIQETSRNGHAIKNVVGRMGEGRPWVIFGAHYDSRIYADRDADITKRELPVPGANDGASGTAVLIELARVIPEYVTIGELKAKEIWLVFFDAEDNGNIANWDWILGSQAFVEELRGDLPDAVIIVDMVGDVDLNLYIEHNSDAELSNQIWRTAAESGYSHVFIPVKRHRIIDDHIPFLEIGIPAVDIIDFDYPYWHTTADTIDKVSPKSLKTVGDTLITWLVQQEE